MKRTLFSPERRCQLTKRMSFFRCCMVPALASLGMLHMIQGQNAEQFRQTLSSAASAVRGYGHKSQQINPARRPRIGEGCWNVAL